MSARVQDSIPTPCSPTFTHSPQAEAGGVPQAVTIMTQDNGPCLYKHAHAYLTFLHVDYCVPVGVLPNPAYNQPMEASPRLAYGAGLEYPLG